MKRAWMWIGLPLLLLSGHAMAQAADGLPMVDAFSAGAPVAVQESGRAGTTELRGTVKRIRDTDQFEIELPGGQTTRIDLENGTRLREGDPVTVTGRLDHGFDGDRLSSAVVNNPSYGRRRYAPIDPDRNEEEAGQRDAMGTDRLPAEGE